MLNQSYFLNNFLIKSFDLRGNEILIIIKGQVTSRWVVQTFIFATWELLIFAELQWTSGDYLVNEKINKSSMSCRAISQLLGCWNICHSLKIFYLKTT